MKRSEQTVIPIPLGMVTAYLIKGPKPILIDTGYPGNEGIILQRMVDLGMDPQSLSLIILTHGHDDHFGSAAALREATGAKIVVHEADAGNLRRGYNGRLAPFGKLGRFLSLFVAEEGIQRNGFEPDIVISDTLNLHEYGIPGVVIPTPGHTPGSVSVILENGEVIIGDLMMAFVRTRRPGYPIWVYDSEQVKESIQKVMSYQPTKIYASHGGPFKPRKVGKRFDLEDDMAV